MRRHISQIIIDSIVNIHTKCHYMAINSMFSCFKPAIAAFTFELSRAAVVNVLNKTIFFCAFGTLFRTIFGRKWVETLRKKREKEPN